MRVPWRLVAEAQRPLASSSIISASLSNMVRAPVQLEVHAYRRHVLSAAMRRSSKLPKSTVTAPHRQGVRIRVESGRGPQRLATCVHCPPNGGQGGASSSRICCCRDVDTCGGSRERQALELDLTSTCMPRSTYMYAGAPITVVRICKVVPPVQRRQRQYTGLRIGAAAEYVSHAP